MAEFVPYETVAEEVTAEFIEKKSRFIGVIAPVETEAEALAFIAAQREKYPGATKLSHRDEMYDIYRLFCCFCGLFTGSRLLFLGGRQDHFLL